jgi:hypothetical protein
MQIGCVLAQAGDLAGAGSCLCNGLPAWPIYSHWQARLEGEIALASGMAAQALAKMASAPPDAGHTLAEWPAYLARAAFAAGQTKVVVQLLTALLANPARYWFNADFNGPGFLNWAMSNFNSFIDQSLRPRASALRQALENSN